MKKFVFILAVGLMFCACKNGKNKTAPSPYQELADQYAAFTLTTDLSKLTENEKKMLPFGRRRF